MLDLDCPSFQLGVTPQRNWWKDWALICRKSFVKYNPVNGCRWLSLAPLLDLLLITIRKLEQNLIAWLF